MIDLASRKRVDAASASGTPQRRAKVGQGRTVAPSLPAMPAHQCVALQPPEMQQGEPGPSAGLPVKVSIAHLAVGGLNRIAPLVQLRRLAGSGAEAPAASASLP